ncbi:S-formylglutathione hydrolase [Platanthera guangdongensis]|uniref:S-formylglutathione hydrolase n=1 Tax=Platanthera guangdongensis TaxID=2320717 RepID=A0ABR2M8C0_9ASPA
MEKPEEMSSTKMFGGFNRRYKNFSPTLGCSMTFSIYFPPSPPSQKIPVLYWLSGLTCTDENFIAKSGAQRAASVEEVALVAPDTSPRGLNIEGEDDSWDFGVGAGFYLNATELKWKNWRMYDYVVKELPKLLTENFELLDTSKASIFGHSMGGHGALTIFLKNQDKYKASSAFSPIVNPINCPWGQKAFSNYLGGNKSDWEVYDATCLIAKYNKFSTPILIDQGEGDKFLKDQLLPHRFEEACKSVEAPLVLRIHPGYDHSYFFIATFIDDHIRHHVRALKSA